MSVPCPICRWQSFCRSMKNTFLILGAAVAVMFLATQPFAWTQNKEAGEPAYEYLSVRFMGGDKAVIHWPDGTAEPSNKHFKQKRPDFADERMFYLTAALNLLSQKGWVPASLAVLDLLLGIFGPNPTKRRSAVFCKFQCKARHIAGPLTDNVRGEFIHLFCEFFAVHQRFGEFSFPPIKAGAGQQEGLSLFQLVQPLDDIVRVDVGVCAVDLATAPAWQHGISRRICLDEAPPF